ncbi:MAG: sel1 repeat family protein [Acidobacteria bacterium]|nr:sel1 repeat family protein [Acidobacteriota bacterium]MBI1855909.1 sel1 repeat family protein [Chloroflexota bacterium]MBI3489940.1 sel1 repeat family protein [Acidobacteriota bacterium]
MNQIKWLWMICTCVLVSSAQGKKDEDIFRLPQSAKQMIEGGHNGDVLSMVKANRVCERWGAVAPFKTDEVQKQLLPLAQAGNYKAMHFLGVSKLRKSIPGPGSEEELGKTWIRRAAEGGYAPAMLSMVSQVSNREERNRWVTRAYDTLRPQAEAGDADAMIELAHVPQLIGETKTPGKILVTNEEGESWLRKAVSHGSIEAMIELSERLRMGATGDSREAHEIAQKEGWELSMKLVQMGYWPTMADIGAAYAYGSWPHSIHPRWDWSPEGQKKLRKDATKAWEWWDKAFAIAGKAAVLKYLLECQNIGDAAEHDCLQIPPRSITH